MKLFCLLLFISIFPSIVRAADYDLNIKSTHYISAAVGQGFLVLGSEDERFGEFVSYAYGRYEPRFHMTNIDGQVVYEMYIDHTQTDGSVPGNPTSTFAAGGLAYARWIWPTDQKGRGIYFDLGWGFQLADQPTLDLDSQFNSTPMTGFGMAFNTGKREYLVGIRYLHISNAGLRGHNFGENELFLMLTLKY